MRSRSHSPSRKEWKDHGLTAPARSARSSSAKAAYHAAARLGIPASVALGSQAGEAGAGAERGVAHTFSFGGAPRCRRSE
eukprot:scaffold251157_cov30-Tisochrysis_lutea.AAC.1